MPTGVVSWFDPKTGEARIRAGGRELATSSSHMEPASRRAGARVHFDIHRRDGAEEARDVRLRAGRRNSPHHRRAGSLVGARRPDTKGPSPVEAFHLTKGLSLATHPLEVADGWGNAVAAGDIEYALALYAPGAIVHAGDEDVSGRRHLQRFLSELPVLGRRHAPIVRGDGEAVLLHWDPTGPDDSGFSVRVRVEHGEIAEQWIGEAAEAPSASVAETPHGDVPIVVTADDDIPREAVDRAMQELLALTEHFDDPLLLVRLKLSMARDPARERPAEARATFDVNGHLVRAQVAAPTLNEAIDRLTYRMHDKLKHLAERREALRRRAEPLPGEWRHGALPTMRPPYFDRPPEERELVRHKAFVADEITAEEAAFDMEQLDHDFHLFRDLTTGQDSLLTRTATGYRVQHLRSAPDHDAHADPAAGVQVEEDPTTAPVLDVAEAAELLDTAGERFVFFADRDTGRGAVIYHRYDGHYGLVTLADGA